MLKPVSFFATIDPVLIKIFILQLLLQLMNISYIPPLTLNLSHK